MSCLGAWVDPKLPDPTHPLSHGGRLFLNLGVQEYSPFGKDSHIPKIPNFKGGLLGVNPLTH